MTTSFLVAAYLIAGIVLASSLAPAAAKITADTLPPNWLVVLALPSFVVLWPILVPLLSVSLLLTARQQVSPSYSEEIPPQ